MTVEGPGASALKGPRESRPAELAFYCVLSILLLIADHHGGIVDTVRRQVSMLTHPVLHLVSTPGRVASDLTARWSSNGQLQKDNDALSEQWMEAQFELLRLRSLEEENERLRKLLDSSPRLRSDILIGEIISADLDPFVHRVVVNRGTVDNAYVGQPLAAAEGIIGQIERVTPHHAFARLITDPSHALPVAIADSGVRTIAYGTGDIDRLILKDLPRSAEINPGDLLLTSGMGGRFPRGFPVARVETVDSDSVEGFLTVVAVPTAQLDRIRELLLVWPAVEGPPEEMRP